MLFETKEDCIIELSFKTISVFAFKVLIEISEVISD
jgi:hypothetical protein